MTSLTYTGLDPLFSKISTMVMETLIADFGRTGFYEADGTVRVFSQELAP
jgi:hypothetical protein